MAGRRHRVASVIVRRIDEGETREQHATETENAHGN
jgi:hypothetical protein